MARAGVWHTGYITVEDSAIETPKNLRRCKDITLKDVSFPNAAETLRQCGGIVLERVAAAGDYFAMNSRNMRISDFTLHGNEFLRWGKKGRFGHNKDHLQTGGWDMKKILLTV